MAHFDTAANIVSNAALELGLSQAAIADPWAATVTDQNVIMLRSLLTRVGRMLVRARDWTHLTREYTFNTANGTASYALPTGFDRIKNQTTWNRTTVLPLGGPTGPQEWQAMKARTSVGTVVRPFRVFGNLLYLYPTPTATEAIYYEYVSQYWVLPVSGGPIVPTLTLTTTATDTLWFDEPLLVAGLKLAWERAKKRDTTYSQAEFDEAYSAAAGGDGASPIISIAGDCGSWMLGPDNLPDTGWGA